MRLLTIRFFLALLVVSGASFRAAGRSPEKLPGRNIETKQLPEAIRRFVLRHYSNLSRFNYRWDKRFYYAFNDNGDYMLLLADGALRGFRFHMRQPSATIVAQLPEASVTHIRNHYPEYFLCTFLPAGEGYRAELFGADDRTLHFDGGGRFVREDEHLGICRTNNNLAR
ncbi:MAG: hypothetical protein LUF83_10950 [Alistipes sp.]|nr:hypothetical protein [Alistipes sp.]